MKEFRVYNEGRVSTCQTAEAQKKRDCHMQGVANLGLVGCRLSPFDGDNHVQESRKSDEILQRCETNPSQQKSI
jgi:hypothetical protein